MTPTRQRRDPPLANGAMNRAARWPAAFAWKQGETRPVRLRAAGSSSRRSPVGSAPGVHRLGHAARRERGTRAVADSKVTMLWMLPATGAYINGAVGGKTNMGIPEVGLNMVKVTLPLMEAPGATVRQ